MWMKTGGYALVIHRFIGNMLFIGNCRIPISKSHKNEVLERLNLIGEV